MTSYHIRQIVCGSVWEISVVQFKRKDRGSGWTRKKNLHVVVVCAGVLFSRCRLRFFIRTIGGWNSSTHFYFSCWIEWLKEVFEKNIGANVPVYSESTLVCVYELCVCGSAWNKTRDLWEIIYRTSWRQCVSFAGPSRPRLLLFCRYLLISTSGRKKRNNELLNRFW